MALLKKTEQTTLALDTTNNTLIKLADEIARQICQDDFNNSKAFYDLLIDY